MQITDEEQLKRFDERAKIEHKRFKITEEDWRNREKAGAYHEAVCDMVDRTSTGTAPWTIVESNDKYFARVKILRTICERLEKELKIDPIKAPRAVITKEPKADAASQPTAREAAGSKTDTAKQSKAQRARQLRPEKASAAKKVAATTDSEKASEKAGPTA